MSIDDDLCKLRESSTIVPRAEAMNLLERAWSLCAKLVAWEIKND